nr:FAD-dependent oxidoreductase [Saprospiraceae bacterium]
MSKIEKNSKICIVGGGPGGLSTAYYLKKAGYTQVTVLEKLPEVGGLCNSITFENRSFDLGANYLTPAYKKTLKIAREIGAKLYVETKAYCYNPETGKYSSILKAVTRETSFLKFSWQAIRYFFERRKAGKKLPEAGFKGVSQHPDLACSFEDWLRDKNLLGLKELFHIPITLMGYGKLDEIPAPYALTYMTNYTFLTLLLFGAGFPIPWPKRFIYGFQRFWEKVSWNLTVVKNADIHKIHRGEKIEVHFTTFEHDMNERVKVEKLMTFDYLVLAVPLTLPILENLFTDAGTGFCGLTPEEKNLFSKVATHPFCLTTFILRDLKLPHRLINLLPVPELGKPYIITQQFEDNPLVSFYSRTNEMNEPDREKVLEYIRDLYSQMGSQYEGECYTHDRWTYFPHVEAMAIKEGFYDTLENLQGKNNTFFTGGLMAFELIEPILNYSDNLVNRHFL